MLKNTTVQLMALGLVGSFIATAAAQDSGALIDALVRKGVLKDQEAEEIRSQMTRDFASNSSAGKLNLSSSVKELKLGGDVRFRHQMDQRQAQDNGATAGSSHDSQRTRDRIRLRINGDYKLSDNFFAGFGLTSENKPDSGNQTLADTGAATPGAGFQSYGLFIAKAFIGWNPLPGVTLIAGKQANPFYTTDMVWDSDINPAGFTERLDLNKMFKGLGKVELSLVGGQYVLQDNNEFSATAAHKDAYLYQTQLIATVPVTDSVKVTLAPGFMCTNGGVFDPKGATLNGNEAAVSLKNDALGNAGVAGQYTLKAEKILLIPGDVSFKVAGLPAKVVWDYAQNLDGKERYQLLKGNTATPVADPIVSPANASGDDTRAWLLGFQLGENKKKGDWSLLANYRRVGIASVDPNINDSDWGLSMLNMQGYKVGVSYNLGEATVLTATYYTANNIKRDYFTAAGLSSVSMPGASMNSVQVLQVDLSVKF